MHAEKKVPRKTTFGEAMFVVVFLIAALISTMMFWGGDPHLAILSAAMEEKISVAGDQFK